MNLHNQPKGGNRKMRRAKVLCMLRKKIKNTKLQRVLDNKIASLDGGYAYSMLMRELYFELYGCVIGYGT